jgi:TPR repeat protein
MELANRQMNYGLVERAALEAPALALRIARPLIEHGDASTHWYLGLMHHLGIGVQKDLQLARKWYGAAAAFGFPRAQDELLAMDAAGRLGRGADRRASPRRGSYAANYDESWSCSTDDCERVFRWLYKGATRDDGDMQIVLGAAYERGVYVQSNRDCALYWYRRACELGLEEGYGLLEKLYHNPDWDLDEYDALDCLEAKVVFILVARVIQNEG